MRTINLDEAEPRVETGVTRFGEDWPGVFIRGDNAFYYSELLERILPLIKEQPDSHGLQWSIVEQGLWGLKQMLENSRVRPPSQRG